MLFVKGVPDIPESGEVESAAAHVSGCLGVQLASACGDAEKGIPSSERIAAKWVPVGLGPLEYPDSDMLESSSEFSQPVPNDLTAAVESVHTPVVRQDIPQ